MIYAGNGNAIKRLRSLPPERRGRGIVVELFFHLYATMIAAVVAVCGVTSPRNFIYAIVTGLGIDGVRHLAVPEFRLSPSEMKTATEAAFNDPEVVIRAKKMD